jgi:hypothetical protein
MKNSFLSSAILASAALLGLSSAAFAQNDAQPNATPAKQDKPAPKPHKVWTEDEVGSLRTPADAYIDAKDKQAAQAAAAQQSATANEKAPPKKEQKGVPPPTLTNPKSLEDADKMIAWENRDVAAQQEFLEKVKQELDDAPADQKERLTKLLEERTKILADTREELKNLETKKKEIEKPAPHSDAAGAQPPSQ